jgi:hypothetical protein
MNPILKKKWISLALIFFCLQMQAQEKLDTTEVILMTAEDYIFWHGYNVQSNDTTKLLKSVIRQYNMLADSILKAKQLEDRVIYTNEVIQNYKSNFFSLITLTKLLDSVHIFKPESIKKAFSDYIDYQNQSSLVEQYAGRVDKRAFLLKYREVAETQGAGWHIENQSIEAFEKSIALAGAQSGKNVTVTCGEGRDVFYDGKYGGPSGVQLVLFKGKTHLIEIKQNDVLKCSYQLIIASNDSGAPVTINCNSLTPCSCSK